MDYSSPDETFTYDEVLPEEATQLGFTPRTKWLCYDCNNTSRVFILPPNTHAVYAWYFSGDSLKRPVYIGKATDIRGRIWQHWNRTGLIDKMLELMERELEYDIGMPVCSVWYCGKDLLEKIEVQFIIEHRPLFNTVTPGNKECYDDTGARFLSGFVKYKDIGIYRPNTMTESEFSDLIICARKLYTDMLCLPSQP